MLDFAGLKASVRALSPTQISDAVAGDCVNTVYQSLLNARPGGGTWFGLKQSWTITTLPDKTGGTVTLTQGSAIVPGVGTAFAATDALRFLQIGNRVPIRIASVQTADQLTLQQVWGEATLAGTPYSILSLRYLLPSNADLVDRLVGNQWALHRNSFRQIDIWDPNRTTRGVPLVYQEMELLSAEASLVTTPNVLSGALAIPQGAVTATITLSAGTSAYEVSGSTSWNTGWSVRAGSKQATSFIVDFSVPAPPGATFDWTAVVQGQSSGLSVVETAKEIELWPVPNSYGTFTLEYKKRVDPLLNAQDVPVLDSELVRWAARAEVCNRLSSRTGDQVWESRERSNAERASALLAAAKKEDSKMRGALRGVLDSEDVSPMGNMAWLQSWRVASALFGST